MSKKKQLAYREYYDKDKKKVSGRLNFSLPAKDSSFDNVSKILVSQKYIFFTREGYYHFLPKGAFFRDAVLSFLKKVLLERGFMEYRFSSVFGADKIDAEYQLIKRFKKDIYSVTAESSKKLFLKYASDPLILRYFANREISPGTKIYSPDYFYRISMKGELKNLINPREFLMTDYHVFIERENFDQYIEFSKLNKEIMESFIDSKSWRLNIDTNNDFYKKNKKKILRMLANLNSDATINVTKEKTHYYSIQNQFIMDYYHGHTSQLANLQYDEQNGELFQIKSKETGLPLTLVHGTPIGRVEKVMGLVFGKEIEKYEKTGVKPTLPLWLSPIICRIIAVHEDVTSQEYVAKLSHSLSRNKIRHDIDDRGIEFRKKIIDSEREWIPFVIVIGKKEINSKTISVRRRDQETERFLNLESLVQYIRADLKQYVNERQTLPIYYQGKDVY